MMPAIAEKEYIAHLDSKNRFSVRGATARLFQVKVFEDGHILLSPRKLVEDEPISEATLCQIEKSISNLKTGKVSSAIDIEEARVALRQ